MAGLRCGGPASLSAWSRRSSRPAWRAVSCRYPRSSASPWTRMIPNTSRHWRSDTEPPRRYQSSLRSTWSSADVTHTPDVVPGSGTSTRRSIWRRSSSPSPRTKRSSSSRIATTRTMSARAPLVPLVPLTKQVVCRVRPRRALVRSAAGELDRMTPDERRDEFRRRIITNPSDLSDDLRAKIQATAERLATECRRVG